MKTPRYRYAEPQAQARFREANPENETPEQRIARVLRTMPKHVFDNPTLRIAALKRAAAMP